MASGRVERISSSPDLRLLAGPGHLRMPCIRDHRLGRRGDQVHHLLLGLVLRPGLQARGSSSSESDEDLFGSTDDTPRRSRKPKALGQVKAIVLDPVPAASGFKAYQLQVYTKVLAASKRSSLHTLKWIQQIETAKLKKLERLKT